jgi:hypothetical protein
VRLRANLRTALPQLKSSSLAVLARERLDERVGAEVANARFAVLVGTLLPKRPSVATEEEEAESKVRSERHSVLRRQCA